MNRININLAALDLNLITSLHALIELQSVSDAAHSVGRTQSAMSHSLSRLREHFHDPILIRDGWRMTRTELAEQLRPQILDVVQAAQRLFEIEVDFSPATTNRRIRIATPDLCASLFTPFIGELSRQAPETSIEFVEGLSARQAVLNAEADVGLGFGHPKPDPNLIIVPIEPLEWCTFTPFDPINTSSAITEQWSTIPHVVVSQNGISEGPIEKASRKHGMSRHITCYASNFSAALSFAAENKALFTTLRAPFEETAKRLGLKICPTPFFMPEAPAALMFRKDYGDKFTLWLREICCSAIL